MQGKDYIHTKSGTIYRVLMIANENSDKWETQVIYTESDSHKNIWARPLTEFLEKFIELT